MGCYDFFKGECPKCQEPFEAQTKLIGEEFNVYTIGANLGLEGAIELKEYCYKCGSKLVAVFEDGVLVRYTTEGATSKEGLYGASLDMSDTRDAQFDREVMDKIVVNKCPWEKNR